MLAGLIQLPRKGNTIMEHLALAVKGLMAITLLGVVFSGIYVYRVWTKDTTRRVKIGVMGFSIEIGEASTPNMPDPDIGIPKDSQK